MINFFSLKLNLESSANQPEVIQLIKSNGGDAIQTSDGLCIKSDLSLEKLKELVGGGGVNITPLDTAGKDEWTKDVQVFVAG